MAIVKVNLDNFDDEVLKSDKYVLVDFWAEWCTPCKMLAPIIDEIAEERTDIKVCKINIDEDGELAARYNIMSIPTVVVFKNGEILKRTVGAQSKQSILSLFD